MANPCMLSECIADTMSRETAEIGLGTCKNMRSLVSVNYQALEPCELRLRLLASCQRIDWSQKRTLKVL